MSDGTIEWEEGFSEGYRSREAEIERLRKDFTDLLRSATNDASAYQAEIKRLHTERNTLRERLELLQGND